MAQTVSTVQRLRDFRHGLIVLKDDRTTFIRSGNVLVNYETLCELHGAVESQFGAVDGGKEKSSEQLDGTLPLYSSSRSSSIVPCNDTEVSTYSGAPARQLFPVDLVVVPHCREDPRPSGYVQILPCPKHPHSILTDHRREHRYAPCLVIKVITALPRPFPTIHHRHPRLTPHKEAFSSPYRVEQLLE